MQFLIDKFYNSVPAAAAVFNLIQEIPIKMEEESLLNNFNLSRFSSPTFLPSFNSLFGRESFLIRRCLGRSLAIF